MGGMYEVIAQFRNRFTISKALSHLEVYSATKVIEKIASLSQLLLACERVRATTGFPNHFDPTNGVVCGISYVSDNMS